MEAGLQGIAIFAYRLLAQLSDLINDICHAPNSFIRPVELMCLLLGVPNFAIEAIFVKCRLEGRSRLLTKVIDMHKELAS